MGELKSLRMEKKMSQKQAAEITGISLRSYKSYENEANKEKTIKYRYLVNTLYSINLLDEDHGILTIEEIKQKLREVFEQYNIEFCYVFGSYAKNKATDTSDVDLLLSTDISGLKYYGLIEEIRDALHKRVDVLETSQLKDNFELTKEILKDGVKIFG